MLSDVDLIKGSPILNKLFEMTRLSNEKQFLIFFSILSMALFFLAIVLRAFLTKLQLNYAHHQEQKLSSELLSVCLSQPFDWSFNASTSEISKKILSEVNAVILGGIMPLLNLITQFFSIIFIVGVLIYVDVKTTFWVSFISISLFVFIWLLNKKKIKYLGQERVRLNAERYNCIYSSMEAFKEIKLANLEEIFTNSFIKSSSKYAIAKVQAEWIARFPRFLIEFLVFGLLYSVIIYFLLIDQSQLLNLIPILATFGVAGYRLLPALQNVYHAISRLRFATPAMESLYKTFSYTSGLSENSNQTHSIPFSSFKIAFQDVSFSYDRNDFSIEKISFDIPENNWIAIVGQSGSGKSTLLDLILGLLHPQSGKILVDGFDYSEIPLKKLQKVIGYVPQKVTILEGSLADNIILDTSVPKKSIDELKNVSSMAQLNDFVDLSQSDAFDMNLGEKGALLSGGQRQRIGIARALFRQPKILILDEATSALDSLTESKVLEVIEGLRQTKTIISVTHRVNTTKTCDKILYLEKGRLIDTGTYDELMLRCEGFRALVPESVT